MCSYNSNFSDKCPLKKFIIHKRIVRSVWNFCRMFMRVFVWNTGISDFKVDLFFNFEWVLAFVTELSYKFHYWCVMKFMSTFWMSMLCRFSFNNAGELIIAGCWAVLRCSPWLPGRIETKQFFNVYSLYVNIKLTKWPPKDLIITQF